MNIIKDLGFGFCTSEKCKLAPHCEECKYFFTCSNCIEELKSRYANNFLLIQKKIFEEGYEEFFNNPNRQYLITVSNTRKNG